MKNINLILIFLFAFIFSECNVKNDNITVEGCIKPTTLQITKIIPDSAYIGNIVSIIGTSFGNTQSTSLTYFNGTQATEYSSWSDSEIKVKVPMGATSGKVWVTVNTKKSNEVDFMILTNIDNPSSVFNWMKRNLDVDHYRNGDSIPEVRDSTEWKNLKTGAWCYYNNDPAMGAIYGKLYNWYAVNDPRGLAPTGWHVPSDDEWNQLEICLGMSPSYSDTIGQQGTDEGGKLKETGTSHWQVPNLGATNSTMFSALPTGYRLYFNGNFLQVGLDGNWWSSTEANLTQAWHRDLGYDYSKVNRHFVNKGYGFSVRCVKDK